MNIYFSGLGGVGIGPLAEIAHDAGFDVIGSDLEESLMTQELRQKDINVNIGQDGSFLKDCYSKQPIDWFVYTSALPAHHPELLLAQKLGIHTAKRDELLAYIIKEKSLKLIAIAGTHGKTTTTGMMIWALKQLDIPVSYSIGTTISFGPSGYFDKNSQYFVYECDEFDKNFLQFSPFLSLITSVDYDHPDTYPTPESYLDAFKQFGDSSQQTICWDDQHSELFKKGGNVKLSSTDINQNIKLAGIHNRRNASLVQAGLEKLGISQSTDDILSSFPGTSRRFEKLADNLYSDYGHHPVEIAATLQLARELSDHIVLVYQPHQNIRQHEIKMDYANQFELAEEIYWLPTYLSREDPNLQILRPQDLIENITNKNDIKVADFNDELWQAIQTARYENKLVVCMGAGKIDGWVRDKIEEKTI
ncbi:MAG: Mur ligase domain-containing protein [Candidatus Saccharimonadales bacterium]